MLYFYNLANEFIVYLHPSLKIKKESWVRLWQERDRLLYKKTATLSLLTASLAYFAHLFLVDIPFKLEPHVAFRNQRIFIALVLLVAAVLTQFGRFKYIRFPALCAGLITSFLQAESMNWSNRVPYGFSIIVPVLLTTMLRLSPLLSSGYLLIAYCLELHAWQGRSHELSDLASAAVVGLGAVIIFSSRTSGDVGLFIAEQESAEAHDKIINYQKELLERKMQESFNLEISASIGKMAAQIVHDIRSPLAALKVIATDHSEFNEERRTLLRASVARIHDIVHILLQQYQKQARNLTDAFTFKTEIKEKQALLVASLVDGIASEIRMRYQAQDQIKVEFDYNYETYGYCVQVNEIELKRAVSNLINNGVEALEGRGLVQVQLAEAKEFIALSIVDSGKGIPPERLSRLGEFGGTYGKKGGTGLGLYHARTQIENWGGKFEIQSEVGKGTRVTLFLPKVNPPQWFIKSISVNMSCNIFVLDDDPSIHHLWDHRFAEIECAQNNGDHPMSVSHFHSPHELINQVQLWDSAKRDAFLRDSLFLIDYELIGSNITGIQLIEQLNIRNRSVVVTGQYEDPTVISGCERLNLKLLPKNMAGVIPIEMDIGNF